MSLAFTVEETIHKPNDQVWAVLTDWPNAPDWMAGIDNMCANGETIEGTLLTFRARGADRHSLIARCVPGRSITLRSIQGNVTAEYKYDLYPIDNDATRIELEAKCQTSGILWKVFSPILRIAIKRVDGNQLANLKRLIET